MSAKDGSTRAWRLVVGACVWALAWCTWNPPVTSQQPSSKPPDSLVIDMIEQLAGESAEVKKHSTEDMVPIPPQGPGDDFWSGMLQITQVDNPLISMQCRREATKKAVEAIGGPEKAEHHAREHLEEWKEILSGDRKISLTKYLDHMVHCTEFCGPLIGNLLKCHIDSIRSCSAVVFTFNVGTPRTGNFQFLPHDLAAINDFARKMRSEHRKILLEARASNLNSRESLAYNLALSQRRADVMTSALIAAGFPARDIAVKSLCWEPPRLAIRDVAVAYGFDQVWARQANPQYIDQSVVLLGYNPQPGT